MMKKSVSKRVHRKRVGKESGVYHGVISWKGRGKQG